MIDPNCGSKTVWNILMLILVVFQSIIVPVRIAFEDVTSYNWMVADYIMDSFFIIDIVINFITALENEQGELITNRKLVAWIYLKGWFWIDFISCAPIELIFNVLSLDSSNEAQGASRFVKLAKLPRIYRILRVLKMIRIFKSSKAL